MTNTGKTRDISHLTSYQQDLILKMRETLVQLRKTTETMEKAVKELQKTPEERYWERINEEKMRLIDIEDRKAEDQAFINMLVSLKLENDPKKPPEKNNDPDLELYNLATVEYLKDYPEGQLPLRKLEIDKDLGRPGTPKHDWTQFFSKGPRLPLQNDRYP